MRSGRIPGGEGRTSRFREAGFVVVWFAISATVLLGFAGLSVDLGNWYLHMSRTQNAADAAALAGAPYLPGSPEVAKAEAEAALTSNGVTEAHIDFNGPDESRAEYMHIVLEDSVKSQFLKFFGLNDFNYQRGSFAAMRQPIEMGSPDNTLGTQMGSPNWSTSGVDQQFWPTQNTWGYDKQNADRWDPPGCSSKTDYCDVTKAVPNIEQITGGREYIIDVGPGVSGYVALEGYDLTMNDDPPSVQPNDRAYIEKGFVGKSVATEIDFYKPGSKGGAGSPVAGCPHITVPPNMTTKWQFRWERICTFYVDGSTNPTGRYHLFIDLPNSSLTRGMNSYALRAGLLSGGPSGPVDMVGSKKIKVFAPGKLVARHESGVVSKYFIARVATGLAGDTLKFQAFDFGNTGLKEAKINWADTGTELKGCSLKMPTTGWSQSPTGGGCTFDTSSVYATFDRRVIEFTIPIPKNYVCNAVSDQSCWLQLTATYLAADSEGASFSIDGVGSPLRLYNTTS